MADTMPPVSCPHCDSPKINRVESVTPESRIDWYHCENCGRMFGRTDISPRPHQVTTH